MRDSPNWKNVLATFGADARVDAIMLRVAELERKFGQGTPDPLVNEIVHRLGALEGTRPAAAGDDSRLDEVEEQLEEFEQRLEQGVPSDPRTDDLVLRIASFESALKKPAQDDRVPDLTARLEEIEKATEEIKADPLTGELSSRLSAIEEDAARKEDPRFEEFSSKLDELQTRADEAAVDPRVEGRFDSA